MMPPTWRELAARILAIARVELLDLVSRIRHRRQPAAAPAPIVTTTSTLDEMMMNVFVTLFDGEAITGMGQVELGRDREVPRVTARGDDWVAFDRSITREQAQREMDHPVLPNEEPLERELAPRAVWYFAPGDRG